MLLNVNWCQGSSTFRALSALLMIITLSCLARPCQCFNLRRQRFSDYDRLLANVETEQQEPPQDGTEPDFRKDSFVLNTNTSIELFSHAKSNSRDIVETILNDENLTNTAKNVDRAKNNDQLVEINLTAVRDELLRELNSEAVTVEVKTDTSLENIRTISEQKFREALERVLQRHLELSQEKLEPTDHSITNNSTRAYNSGGPLSSQLICQFFVFGTLFGVVCSISTCTCCLQPRASQRRSAQLNGVNPTNVPAPIDYSKPYMIKCDSQGSCYASPLNDDEVPPLPSYNKALTCPTQPSPPQQSSTT